MMISSVTNLAQIGDRQRSHHIIKLSFWVSKKVTNGLVNRLYFVHTGRHSDVCQDCVTHGLS
ncbi:hypothetical protein F383_13840 [Gossypium arboreum]|uniref:Uncharacterized protein n=1 Tax=Gossypium arboreum TaxID=29729 RepID=A0A0B0NE13_GOSAR|nr:hypothetical protein F383_13840 [Gossypium arboreum]